jgi:hypothetical protein
MATAAGPPAASEGCEIQMPALRSSDQPDLDVVVDTLAIREVKT